MYVLAAQTLLTHNIAACRFYGVKNAQFSSGIWHKLYTNRILGIEFFAISMRMTLQKFTIQVVSLF